jgi:hypothetical protein
MSKEKKPPPKANPEKEDVKILPPDYALKKMIGENVDINQIFSAENISKAQEAIDSHKDNFLEWVKNDLMALEENYKNATTNIPACEADIGKLAKVAFVIKSQAGTFGFSLATLVAKSLDDFCNRDFRPSPEHLTVIRKHIDALQAIFSKNIAGDGGTLGRELSSNLDKLVAKYTAK